MRKRSLSCSGLWHDASMDDTGTGSVRVGGVGNHLVLSLNEVGPGDSGDVRVWSLVVELRAEGLSATTSVWLGAEGVEEPLSDFFARLAADWKGWDGTRSWLGMDHGLDLHCVNDGISTAHLDVVLRHLSGADWTAEAVVPVDLGQLASVAANLARLLTV
jgi:hypothetical protein